MAEVDTIVVLDGNGDSREVPTILSLETRVGEVQTTPTTNTVLGRLKAIADKLSADPATAAKQDAAAVLLQGIIDAIGDIPGGGGGGGDASLAEQQTQTARLTSILAKIIAAPATEAKQDTLIAKDFATQTTLAALLAKVIAAPATEAKQDTLIAKDFATQTTLAAVLAKLSADPATQTTLAAVLAKISADPATQTTLAAILAAFKAEDAAHVSGDLGLQSLAVRRDTAVALGADGDYMPLIVDATGRLHVVLAGVPTALGQGTMAQSLKVAIASDQSTVPVGGNTSYIDVTLSLDTNAYADGDLMADTQVVTNAMRINDGTGVLQSVQVLDEDDQGGAFDLVFLSANNTMGTENSAPSVSDANARDILGFVSVAGSDFIDLGGARIATKTGLGLVVKPASGTRNLYVAAISRGTATYTATGVRLRLGFLLD